MPKRLRCHALAHRSHQSLLRIFRDLILWCWRALILALNYSETSCFGTSESPIIAPDLQSIPTHAVISLHGRDILFFCSQQLIYIWDTPTLTKPGSCSKKCSLWQREIGRFDLFAQPARVFIYSIAFIRRFSIPSLLFTLYPKPRVETKEYSHPPWMGLLQPVQVERFDQNRSSCAEMSVVRTIYHRRILDKREGKRKERRKLMRECRSKVRLFYTQQTDKTNTKHVLFKN